MLLENDEKRGRPRGAAPVPPAEMPVFQTTTRTGFRDDPRIVIGVAAAVALGVIGLLIAAFVMEDNLSTATENASTLATPSADESVARSGDDVPLGAGMLGTSAGGSEGNDGTEDGAGTGDIGTSVVPSTAAESTSVTTAAAGASSTTTPTTPTTAAPTTAAPTTAAPTTAAPTTAAPTTAAPTTAAPTTPPTTAAPTTAAPTTAATAAPGPKGDDSAIRQEILALTNAERAKVNCPALSLNGQLNAAADGHAEDMAANDYFSHTDRNGGSPFDRMKAAGYQYSAAGENIAAGQPTAASVMSGWMNSPGHRANIENCRFAELGVGYGLRGNTRYWVQVFGTR